MHQEDGFLRSAADEGSQDLFWCKQIPPQGIADGRNGQPTSTVGGEVEVCGVLV